MNKIIIDQLTKALIAAQAAADAEAKRDPRDGGTCNFDSPVVFLSTYPGNTVPLAAEESGVKASAFTWSGMGGRAFWLGTFQGQGDLRTRMAEKFNAVLREHGIDSYMYYQMD